MTHYIQTGGTLNLGRSTRGDSLVHEAVPTVYWRTLHVSVWTTCCFQVRSTEPETYGRAGKSPNSDHHVASIPEIWQRENGNYEPCIDLGDRGCICSRLIGDWIELSVLLLFLFLASFEAIGTRENLSFVCHVALCLFLVYVKRINQRPSPLRLNKAQTQPMHLCHRQPIKGSLYKALGIAWDNPWTRPVLHPTRTNRNEPQLSDRYSGNL